jgi:hypothetical protein
MDHVLMIATDVVLTGVNQEYVDRAGVTTGAGKPSYVWRRTRDGWRIVVGRNTTVVA